MQSNCLQQLSLCLCVGEDVFEGNFQTVLEAFLRLSDVTLALTVLAVAELFWNMRL